MAERLLGKSEIEDIVLGATLLGAGGGGSPKEGLALLEKIDRKITLVDPEDLPEQSHAVAVAGIGAPKAISEQGFGSEAVFAYEAMKRMTSVGGIKIDYLFPAEIGGFNTVVPFYVASKKNIPVIDNDGNGRAVPELATGLYPIYKIPTSPLVIANKDGDTIVAYLSDPLDTAAAEKIARGAAISFGMLAAFSTWVCSIETIKRCLVPRSISKAERVGKAIRESRASGKDVLKEVTALAGGKELFRGRLLKIEQKTAGGFDFGKTTIEGIAAYKGKRFIIDVKNENIIAWQDDKPVIMAPDLICMMTTTGIPLTNADIEEGMEVGVIGMEAPEPWKRIPDGFNCWKHILEKLGYDGGYSGPF